MKKIIMLSSLLIAFSCEDKISDDDNDDNELTCDQLEAAMWKEYNVLVGEYNSTGVTQATCTSTKAAIEAVKPWSASDPDFYKDVNDTSELVNSLCG